VADAFDLVCLDADDTLWFNEVYFRAAEGRLAELLHPWADAPTVADRLVETELANIPRYGFGAKAFVLSMIETALVVSDDQLPNRCVHELLDLGKAILDQPVELLDDVAEVIEVLAARWPLVLVTKGDLVHQESKFLASGLADHFRAVDVVAEKDPATYRRVVARHGVDPSRIVMVGNSVKSDVVPVLEIGGWAVLVPHEHGWVLEHAELPDHPRLRQAEAFADVPAILAAVEASAS
jgi:putative hydrolase of the HAD superfamily